jgi:uncharacterized membrane protein (UPF0127 family)
MDIRLLINDISFNARLAHTAEALKTGLSMHDKPAIMLLLLPYPMQVVDDMSETNFNLDAAFFNQGGLLVEHGNLIARSNVLFKSQRHDIRYFIEAPEGWLTENLIQTGHRLSLPLDYLILLT